MFNLPTAEVRQQLSEFKETSTLAGKAADEDDEKVGKGQQRTDE